MKRRKFLIQTTIASAALGSIPFASFASGMTNNKIVRLPSASSQIRHGLLSPEKVRSIRIDNVLSVFGRHIFFKNGFDASENDLINFSFRLYEESYCLSCLGDRVFLNESEFIPEPGVTLKIHEKLDRELYLLQGKDLKKDLTSEFSGYFFPLQGNFKLNGNEVENDVVVEVKGRTELISIGSCKLLIINTK